MNFWEVHGLIFVFFMFFFPRLTLLLSSVAFGGFFWFLGWLFVPRLLVAVLATTAYWHTNPLLVVITWFWAIGFESGEKRVVATRTFNKKRHPKEGVIIDI